MRIAYLILAHANPNQLKRLINRLNNENVSFFIHIDKHVQNIEDYYLPDYFGNIHFIKQRIPTKWGAYSIVQATLNGLEEIVDSYDGSEYVCLLSGSDYPLKTNRHILDFFENNKGKEFLYNWVSPSPELPYGGLDRFEYYFNYDSETTCIDAYEKEMKQSSIKRKYMDGLLPYHGSQWWNLTIGCVRYVLDYIKQNKEITNFYRYTRYPDEQFFQTIIMNSGFASNVVNDSLRYLYWPEINWARDDWATNPPHPVTLTQADLPALLVSDKLFARKFDENTDRTILDTLDLILSYSANA